MSSFNDTESKLKVYREADIGKIPGLTYIPDYINEREQAKLVATIEQQEWSVKAQRRVQQYGYQYDYKNGEFSSSRYLGDLPAWLDEISGRFRQDGLTSRIPDQVIINEYEPGQGIVGHIDCIPCFGNTVITLSLGSACLLEFYQPQTHEQAKILVEPGSLVVFQKAARYVWEHGIAERDRDIYYGQEIVRTRRISLTFREVLFPYK
ncbi:MAG TPA: alpha-ketoglutarate-dependent dioxygenase AlkB [Allocoleopsis sp.]